jgi:tetratricopeptide (TPR) repeat protein
MGSCVEEHGGTIDKFIGDCIMALFGVPAAQEDAPHRAINTALEIRKRLQRFNEDKKLSTPLNIHIGINTGPVIAGLMGSVKRQDFTVMGDAVNLASRMESSAEKGDILVAEDTFSLTEGYFDFESIGGIQVKGRDQLVKAYKVIGPRRTITRIEASLEKGLSPFVGRNKELDHLRDRFEQAAGGRGQVVGIVGEPGVGKSRLIRQFREYLPENECTCIEGGCIHFGDAVPYLPILDLLKDYYDLGEDENEGAIKQKMHDRTAQLGEGLAYILPSLHEILSLKVDDQSYLALDPKARRNRVFEAIRTVLIAEAPRKPLVVIIEDLHWIDKTSEEFLAYLINSLPSARILLVLLFRPEYNPGAWVTKSYCSQVRVDQFSRTTTADLVNCILKDGEVAQDLIDFISQRTEGNPLFIEEMVYNLLENASIQKEGDRYSFSLSPTDIQVPATIQGIIAARLDRLEVTLKGIMQTASVIGREFAFRILQAVASMKDDLKSSLLTLQELELIYEKAIFPELEFIFKHALTREVAYNSQLIKKRKETHGQVAHAIEEIYADRLEEFYEMLAYHYSLSDNSRKACSYLKLSGKKAERNYANWEAVRFYREALEILKGQQEDENLRREKLEVLFRLFGLMNFFGYPEGSLQYLQEAERIALELGDQKKLSWTYTSLTYYHTMKGNMRLSLDYSEKSFHLAEQLGDIKTMVAIGHVLCTANWNFGDLPSCAEIGLKTIKSMEDNGMKSVFSGGLTLYTACCSFCGLSIGWMGRLEESRQVLGKGLANAIDLDDKYGIGLAENMYTCLSSVEGDGKSVIDHGHKGLKKFEEAGVEMVKGFITNLTGKGYSHLGDHRKAREYALRGLELQKSIGLDFMTCWCYWHTANVYFLLGDLEEARECNREALRISRESSTKICEAVSLILLGSLMEKQDPSQLAEAKENLCKGISILEEKHAPLWSAFGYLHLGEFLADTGRNEEAREKLNKALSIYLDIHVAPESYYLARTREALAKLHTM